MTEPVNSVPEPTFAQELESLINRYSQENGSNTPDFVLAQYLVGCLANWDACVTRREEWYGRSAPPSYVHSVIDPRLDQRLPTMAVPPPQPPPPDEGEP